MKGWTSKGLLALSVLLSATGSQAAPSKVDGRVMPFFATRQDAPVVVRLSGAATTADLVQLERAGLRIARRENASPRGFGPYVAGHIDVSDLDTLQALPQVAAVEADGSPFPMLPPIATTASEVQAYSSWYGGAGTLLTGEGVVVCDIDSGLDVFHPSFFRADAGYHAWRDEDDDGRYSEGDSIELDGARYALSVLDHVVLNRFTQLPIDDSDDPSFLAGHDWLYADLNDNGVRDFGAALGFDDTSPSFGEPLFVADDVDGDGVLDVDEKIVGLGSSKLRAAIMDDVLYLRGANLIDLPQEGSGHGTSASSIIVGGQRGFSSVGIAPDADLVMASSQDGELFTKTDFCLEHGAQVVLHEYAPWQGYYLDGSSALEQLIDTSSATIAHINPAGNLSGSKKLYKRSIVPGLQTRIAIDVPVRPSDYRFFGFTMLWRDSSRALAMTIEDASGATQQLPTTGQVFADIHDGLQFFASRQTSPRGTARVDIYIYAAEETVAPLPLGRWTVTVDDPSPANAGELEVLAYVQDDVSRWGLGIHFPEYDSEDHLVGFPGTADHGIGVAAYTGHGFYGGQSGQRASYSGRGRRFDGFELLSVSAPDDPITAVWFEEQQAVSANFGGTSGASPHVAGAAVLLKQADPTRSGDDIRAALRDGAIADHETGDVPNDDWGYGKLRIHRSLYGVDPSFSAELLIDVPNTQLFAGEVSLVPVRVSGTGQLTIEHDIGYDGSWDEVVTGALELRFDATGNYVEKLRVVDASGREAHTLSRIEVVEPPMLLGIAGGCSTSPSNGEPPIWWLFLGFLAVVRKQVSPRATGAAPGTNRWSSAGLRRGSFGRGTRSVRRHG
jgi:subtilisin family serine protease